MNLLISCFLYALVSGYLAYKEGRINLFISPKSDIISTKIRILSIEVSALSCYTENGFLYSFLNEKGSQGCFTALRKGK